MSKIAIIANCTWNIKNFRLGLIQALIEQGHETIVIAPEDDSAAILKEKNIPYFPIKYLSRKGKNPIRDLLLIREIKQILKKESVDIILNFTIKPVIYGTLAAKPLDTKVINTITGLGYSFLSTGLVNKVVNSLYKYAFRYSDIIAFQNPDDRSLFEQMGLVKNNILKIIPGSGVHSSKFSPSYANENKDNIVRFLFIGRLLKDKGIHEYISAAKLLTKQKVHAKFHVAGSVDFNNPSTISESEFNNWNENPNIIYHGESKDIKSIIEKVDVVVLPSYREGLPRVLLEAMSMEKPIIATNVPGCRETVKDNLNGYLVEAKNVTSLAQTMHDIINIGEEKRTQMGKEGRKYVLQKFDEKIIINIYIDLINNLKI